MLVYAGRWLARESGSSKARTKRKSVQRWRAVAGQRPFFRKVSSRAEKVSSKAPTHFFKLGSVGRRVGR